MLGRLAPDVLLTQDLCGVCSVTEDEVRAACGAAGVAPQILSLSPRSLPEVWDSIDRIGAAVGSAEAAQRLTGRLRRGSIATESADGRPRPSVAVVEWADPPILAGLWTPDIIEGGGGVPVGPATGEPGQRTDWERLRALQPDLVILAPCSFSVERTRTELERLPSNSAVHALRPRLGFWLADEAYFSRPGPRLIEGVRLVRALTDGQRPATPMPATAWAPGGRA